MKRPRLSHQRVASSTLGKTQILSYQPKTKLQILNEKFPINAPVGYSSQQL